MKSFIRFGLAAGLLAGSLFAAAPSVVAAPAAPSAIWEVNVEATVEGLTVKVLNDDNDGSSAAYVEYTIDFVNFSPVPFVDADYIGNGYWIDMFHLAIPLACGTRGMVTVYDPPASPTVMAMAGLFANFPGVPVASVPFEAPPCELLGSIRGTAYKDGAIYTGAWYKITDGGNWYVCGTVGGDGTFGVPVKAGTYYVIPLDQPGWKASDIMKVVVEAGKASLGNDIKYTRDPSAKHESCDLYNPPKPIPAELRK